MYKSLEDLWTDRVYRKAYGDDIGYDSEKGVPTLREGVGKIEDGPSNPRARIPSGKVSNVTGPIQSIPTAFSTETVLPARLQAKTQEDYSKSEVRSAIKAQTRLKNYLNKIKTGQLK
jgi:hypothetical protein